MLSAYILFGAIARFVIFGLCGVHSAVHVYMFNGHKVALHVLSMVDRVPVPSAK